MGRSWLTTATAIKTNIFGQLNWSIRRPTEKQAKQLKREERDNARRARAMQPDPRKEKEEQILKHTGWKK
jgi:large subunit ribosomal protein L32